MDAHLNRPTGRSTLSRVLAVWLRLLTTGIALLAGTGLRLNLSGSLPLGFYRLTAAGIERGALMTACFATRCTNPVRRSLTSSPA